MPVVSSINSITELNTVFPDECSLIDALMLEGYLKSEQTCDKCGRDMHLRKRKDGYEWRCRESKKKDCSSKSVKSGSWFNKTKVSFRVIFQMFIMFSNKHLNVQVEKELKVSGKTITDYKSFFRELCTRVHDSYDKIGGGGDRVQIDETAFHVRKYGRGEIRRELEWLFGGYSETTSKCFGIFVKDRSGKTLMRELKKHVKEDSVIISDAWKGYSNVKNQYQEHIVVNHSENYADEDGNNTNSVEAMWSRFKKQLKAMNGVKNGGLDRYVIEQIVRQNEGDGFHATILHEMKSFVT